MKKHRIIAMLLCVCMMAGTVPQVWAVDNEVTYESPNDESEHLIPSASIFALSTADYSGQCGDNAYWELDTTTGTLTISGSGDMDMYDAASAPWHSYRGNIKTIVINNGVTSIGSYAFSNCSNLTDITIPDSVTSIGYNPFNYCSSLATIIVNPDNQHYSSDEYGVLYNKNKTILVKYPIGNIQAIYTVSDGTTSIGDNAFYGCSSLTDITIPDSVTSIGNGAFEGCSSLTSITIPDSVTSIGYNAFYGCRNLTNITIPDSVTSIGNGAFEGCSSLTNITIPDSVTSIGESAFEGCSSLINITIPDSVTSIGYGAFGYCQSLTNITIPDSVTSISHYAFRSCLSLTSITIPNSVTSIGYGAFEYCQSLTNITIPDNVTSIGSGAFQNCFSLTNITIPNSVTSIGYSAFQDCRSLTNITIPDNVTSIGSGAFYECRNLTSAYFMGDVPTDFGSMAFDDTASTFTIYYIEGKSGWTTPTWTSPSGNVYNTATFSPINSIPSEAVYYNGSYYMLYEITSGFTGSNAWNDAKSHCESLGGHLAVISSQQENDFLYSYIKSLNCDTAYFGYTDEETEGIWKWITNEINTYTNWHSGEPNSENPNENYASFYWKYTDGTWNDGNFGSGTQNDKRYYICEWETNIPPTRITTTFDTSEITLQIGETFNFVGSATQTNSNIDKVYVAIVKADDETNGIDYFYTENIGQSLYDLSAIPSFTAGSTLINIKHTNTIQDNLTLGVGKYVLRMWVNNDQGETSGEIRKVINVVEKKLPVVANKKYVQSTDIENVTVIPYITFTENYTGEFQTVYPDTWYKGDISYEIINENIVRVYASNNIRWFNFEIVNANQIKYLGCSDEQIEQQGLGWTKKGDIFTAIDQVKPMVTGLQNNYTLTQGEDIELKFTVTGGNGGTLNKVTIKRNVEETTVSHTFDVNHGTDTLTVSGVYLNALQGSELHEIGTYEFCVYASAYNYTVPDNLIAKFTVTVLPEKCSHNNFEFIKYLYGDKQYYDDSTHSISVTPQYKCNICGCVFSTYSTYQSIEHNHDIQLDNSGWYCNCGYVFTGGFKIYRGYLQSSEKEKVYNKVYSDSTLVEWDGISKVFPEDNIEVLGTKNNAFLIRYNVNNGGTKTKFIDRNLIDYYPFVGKKILYFNIDDIDVKTIYSENDASSNSLKYYADINELPNAIKDCSLKYSGNDYNCNLSIGNPKTSVIYSMSVDLSNYMNNNWANVYAVENVNNSTINDFCIGAYVHYGKIYLEITELLDFLGYTCIDDEKHIYVILDDKCDRELTGRAYQIYNTSRGFDQIYESFNDIIALGLSNVFYTLMLDFENKDNIAGIKDGKISEQKLIDEIKASLLMDVMNLPLNMQEECNDFLKEIIDSYREICNISSEVPDIINETIITQLFNNNLKGIHLATKTQKIFDNVSQSLSVIGVLINLYDLQSTISDLTSITMTEIYCAYVLTKNYENNIMILDNLTNNAQTPKMKALYTKVKDELSAYYENNIVKIFYYLADNLNIRQAFTRTIVAGYTVVADTAILLSEGVLYPLALYKMLSSYVDSIFTGTAMYNAQNEIIKLNQSIELYKPELKTAIKNYETNPTDNNKKIVIMNALILGNLRLDGIKYCRELIYNQSFLNIWDYWFNNYKSLNTIEKMLYEDETSIMDCMEIIEKIN